MGLPAKRRTKQSKRERAAHFGLAVRQLVTCSHCRRRILPHQVCPRCGYYQGREVIKMKLRSGRGKRNQRSEAEAKT